MRVETLPGAGAPRRGPVHLCTPGLLPTPVGRHLVALDIDGTILHHDGTLSPVVADAVAGARDAGHEVVIATGRSLLSALPVARRLGLTDGYLVTSNGAVVAELDEAAAHGARIVLTETFDPAPALAALRGSWPDARVAVEEVGLGFKVSAEFDPGELDGRIRVVDWDELISGPATRVTFRSPSGTAQDFLALVERVGLKGVNYAVGFTAWLDIAAEGVSKASGLERVRSWEQIARSRTVAVGDQRNDCEMLSWAACGVAMGNAPDEVKASADLVAAHVLQDGLADVLRALPSNATGTCCA
ncbi:MAG: HAD-IIB family hydrolase [Austwickia sp.]|nr:MAG: HAD-IIB family hydrolase [Austwickia sp.]